MAYKGYILMWEEEPIAFFYNKADAEEMWLALWEEEFYSGLNRTINLLNVSVNRVISFWDSYKRTANYGWWIGEVPFLE